jgi:hypothetical protein
MRLTTLPLSFAFLAAACTGSIPSNGDPDAATGPDGSTAPLMVTVSGMTYDYFSLTPTPLPQTTLAIEGVTPPVTNTSDTAGNYTFDVPPGSTAYAIATKAPAYRPTRNPTLVTQELNMTMDMYAGSNQETLNLYNVVGTGPIAPQNDTAVVIAQLARNDGTPLDQATLADIQFVDSQTPPQPVPGISGPYFFDINGQLDGNATTAILANGMVRIGILNCPVAPAGISYNLLVAYTTGQGQPATFTVPIMCDSDGLTLARTGGMGGGGGGGGGGMGIPNPQFARDVWPRLQRPALSDVGRACASCHNNARLAPNGPQCLANATSCVPWSAETPATDLLPILQGLPGVLVPPPDVATSLFLTKPLLELTPPQNHPNTTFLSTTDPDYIIFMDWISQGMVP